MTKPKKQVERYNMTARKRLPSPENVERFLDEYEEICIAHGLAFGHEDTQGAFVIEDCDKGGLAWARAAKDNSTPRDQPEIEAARVAEARARDALTPAQIEREMRALAPAELTAITSGSFVEAIRLVNKRTDFGLAKSKQIVDEFPWIEQAIRALAPLTDNERVAFFDMLKARYCQHCGREQPKTQRRCQCENDE